MEELLKLLSLLYRAILDEDEWKKVMAALEEAFHCNGSALYVISDENARIVRSNLDPQTTRLYNEGHWEQDIWALRARDRQVGEVWTGQGIAPKRDLPPHFRHDFLDANDIEDILFLKAFGSAQYNVFVSLFRSRDEKPFGENEIAAMKFISEHIVLAIQIRERMMGYLHHSLALDEAFYLTDTAAYILDERLRICWMNKAADRIIEGHKSRDRQVMFGRLMLGCRQAERDLQDAVTDAIRFSREREVVLNDMDKRSPVLCHVIPLSNGLYEERLASFAPREGRRRCLVVARDPAEWVEATATTLRGCWDLTEMEIEVGILAAKGLTLEELCEQMGGDMDRCLTHVAALIHKTGVRSYEALLCLLTRLGRSGRI